MNEMKKILFKVALPVLTGMFMVSCGDFLEIYPLTMVYEDNYWNEKSDVDQIVTGCYTRMQDDAFCRRLFIWGEVRSDNVVKGYDYMSATSSEYYILNENILSTNAYTTWTDFYSVIDRCNLVIEKAPQVAEVDPNYLQSDVLATIAEVTALRSLCYFYLVRAFKDVPYYTYAITNDEQELNLPATDGDEIVRNCISDLVSVYGNALRVWPKQNGQDISYGRITQYAIFALLADMYLWLNDYVNAAYYADLVISYKTEYFEENYSSTYNVNGYPLIPDNNNTLFESGAAYNANFGTGGGPESIFELDFSDDTDEKWNDVPAEFFYRFPISGATEREGLFAPSDALMTEISSPVLFLAKSDSRIMESIKVDSETSPSEAVIAKYAYLSINPSQSVSNAYSQRINKNDANWVFYRVSDMMLIKAEALIYQMSDSEESTDQDDSLRSLAFELIKTIEDRSASNTSSTLSEADFSTKSLMINLVFDARRREFLFEGKRWFDLVRRSRRDGNTDYLVDQVKSKYTENANTATSKLGNMNAIYWPYNYDQIQINTNLTQNPAYPEAGSTYESTN